MRRKWATFIGGCALLTACQGVSDVRETRRTDEPRRTDSTGRPAPGIVPSVTAGHERTVIRDGHAFPDRTLTPGDAVSGASEARVCSPGWRSAPDAVPTDVQKLVFFRYGVPYAERGRYELDHLIPIELGGSNSDINLWPQVRTDNDADGPSKDLLEAHLHALVCAHRLDLRVAQRGIAEDWLRMWNEYEHVAAPG